MQFREDRGDIRDAMVIDIQPKNKLGDRGGSNNKVSTIVQKEYKEKRRQESRKGKENNHYRRGENCKIDSR